MSGSDHLQPQQLKMFMTPREITSNYDPLEGDRRTADDSRYAFQDRSVPAETDTQLWDRKLTESKVRPQPMVMSLHEDIAKRGVTGPVHLTFEGYGSRGKDYIAGGHHRIAAAMDTRPDDLIPVLHHRSVAAAQAKTHPLAGPQRRVGFKYT